jgi:glycine oxidase
VKIMGAGIIGLACAHELIRRGHAVTVFDPEPGLGASHAAAGMLGPAGEAWYGEDAHFELGRASLAMWPEFAATLGVAVEPTATLLVGSDTGDAALVERHAAMLAGHGITADLLGRRELRSIEPALGSRITIGAILPDDRSVDPRAIVAALLNRIPVTREDTTFEASDGYDAVVVATGWTLPAPFAHLVHGVRGEIIRARLDHGAPTHTVRGWVRGRPAYVVPRPTGEVVVGATSEIHPGDPETTLGGIHELLDIARELVPALDRATFADVTARHRPATADQLPLVGPSDAPGVVLAAGHYRSGVLLAPLTATLVADHLDSGRVEPLLDPRRAEGRAWTSA